LGVPGEIEITLAIVTYVLGDCPACGAKDSFGNVDVHESFVYRGCKHCRHREQVKLPSIKKKILYVDQFFFSSAFRAGDSRFTDAAKRIERLAALQLLAVPFSSLHEDEANQWEKRKELMEFIRSTAHGKKFILADEVEQRQLDKAYKVWLAGGPTSYTLDRRDVLRDSVDQWGGYMRVDITRYIGDIDRIRDLKGRTAEMLVDRFEAWRQEAKPIEDDLRDEHLEAARTYMHSFLDSVSRMNSDDPNAFLNTPALAEVVQSLLYAIPDDAPDEQHLRICGAFLTSEHFRQVPYQWLSAHMFATLKAMVRDGAYTNRERAIRKLTGFYYDVKHIATYAPYVDAIVMDQPMAELVAKPTVGLKDRYGVKIFSLNNWDELRTWLDGVEAAGMTEEHRKGLALAYPRV